MSWFFMFLIAILTGVSWAVMTYSLHIWIKHKVHEWAFAAVLSFLLAIMFGHMLVDTWGAIRYESPKNMETELHTEKYQIVETTEGKFIPYEITSITGTKCISSDGSEWGLKYEDEYCIYDDEKTAREAIHASIVRYYTVHKSKHTPQRVIGVQ